MSWLAVCGVAQLAWPVAPPDVGKQLWRPGHLWGPRQAARLGEDHRLAASGSEDWELVVTARELGAAFASSGACQKV